MRRFSDEYFERNVRYGSPPSLRNKIWSTIFVGVAGFPVLIMSAKLLGTAPDIWAPIASIPSCILPVFFMAFIVWSFPHERLRTNRLPLHIVAWLGFLSILPGTVCAGYGLTHYKIRRPELQPPPGTRCGRAPCGMETEQILLGMSVGFLIVQM
ncbi:hypothetical protein AJ80_04105 [Polytolypa hystricis UAMH7299]|uniref:Uncharacterized protein n=1 Tax=Polytolypa hystricis (strain UAMH7299) TaxID=1447883 RepID=A0A2B7YDH3_POLH7|nr:hypothetical protein AJ80_04105 [Polytolypa hystricis UAMH7299]